MKKLLFLITVLALIFTLVSCGEDGDSKPNTPPHEHEFVEGKCECGESDPDYVPPHEHVFVDGKCECGEADPDYVPPHEHVFVDGKCECGEADPDYVPPHDEVLPGVSFVRGLQREFEEMLAVLIFSPVRWG